METVGAYPDILNMKASKIVQLGKQLRQAMKLPLTRFDSAPQMEKDDDEDEKSVGPVLDSYKASKRPMYMLAAIEGLKKNLLLTVNDIKEEKIHLLFGGNRFYLSLLETIHEMAKEAEVILESFESSNTVEHDALVKLHTFSKNLRNTRNTLLRVREFEDAEGFTDLLERMYFLANAIETFAGRRLFG